MTPYAVFIPGEAQGAIPNGTPIVKVAGEKGDTHPIGARGVVLASHVITPEMLMDALKEAPGTKAVKFMYFVAWSDDPKLPVGVSDWKIAEAP